MQWGVPAASFSLWSRRLKHKRHPSQVDLEHAYRLVNCALQLEGSNELPYSDVTKVGYLGPVKHFRVLPKNVFRGAESNASPQRASDRWKPKIQSARGTSGRFRLETTSVDRDPGDV